MFPSTNKAYYHYNNYYWLQKLLLSYFELVSYWNLMNAWIKWILINATFSSKIVLYSLETQGSGSQKTLHQKSLPSLLSSLHECYTNLIVLQCSSYLQKQKKISNERASMIIICMLQLLMIQPYRFLTSKLWLLAFIPENPIIHKMDTSKTFEQKTRFTSCILQYKVLKYLVLSLVSQLKSEVFMYMFTYETLFCSKSTNF